MFSRPTKSDGSPDPTAAAPRKLAPASLVAEGLRIKGDIVADGDLHLDGAVDGDIRVGHLTIGETGAVAGSIQADTLDVRGRVTGAVSAQVVRLWATARVDGDISHAELSIEAGAHFEGRSLTLATEPAALSVVAAE